MIISPDVNCFKNLIKSGLLGGGGGGATGEQGVDWTKNTIPHPHPTHTSTGGDSRLGPYSRSRFSASALVSPMLAAGLVASIPVWYRAAS